MRIPLVRILLATAAVALLGAPAAQAEVACTTRAETTVFAPWSDTASYFPLAGGTYEAGQPAWTLAGGATLVDGNEPWQRLGAGSRSLRLAALGASATSDVHCLDATEDTIRFFVRRPGVVGALLHLHVTVWNRTNGAVGTTDYDIDGAAAGWAPGPAIKLPNLVGSTGRQWLQVRLDLRGTSTAWLVDDVVIDPYKGR